MSFPRCLKPYQPTLVAVCALVACLLTPLLKPTVALAQPPSDGPRWSLGVGVVLSPEPYVGTDEVNVQPIPVIGFESKRFYFRGIVAGLRLVQSDAWDLDWIIAKARFAGYEADDSEFLEGMEDRDISADGGLAARFKLGRLRLELEALTDLLGRHEGQELAADLAWPIQSGRQWRITPRLGARWQSDDLVRYYFGVEPDEARPGRPAYSPDAEINLEAGLELMYFSRGRWIWRAQVKLDSLGSEIEDSPIVDRSTSFSGFSFISWRL